LEQQEEGIIDEKVSNNWSIDKENDGENGNNTSSLKIPVPSIRLAFALLSI
jgi:hypothetical protein